ncbi:MULTISPECIES: acyl carrier protein [Ramlibacter]|uniref:Acyl carrier protein n=1 Tax=Ramlibacter pinisoli TaxID=2682844 RepID=A0A6N8J0S6_9BURK|nr:MULTISPECIES: acyl carrier protein [Ramlibacter]MBA2962948.1 acyl carrier protein [Ramlibacter sp. CGMCC 1.13660]MVQ32891.1 acyl carrier protein [Ramlibacter pinisoli]
MATSTFDRLAALVAQQHAVDPTALTPATGLADAGLDSLAVAELLFTIEDTFGVNLGDMDVTDVPATVGEVVALIDSKLAPA